MITTIIIGIMVAVITYFMGKMDGHDNGVKMGRAEAKALYAPKKPVVVKAKKLAPKKVAKKPVKKVAKKTTKKSK